MIGRHAGSWTGHKLRSWSGWMLTGFASAATMARKVGFRRATSRRRRLAVGGTWYERAAQLELFGKVTRGEASWYDFTQCGCIGPAALLSVRAARMKVAPAGRIRRIRNLPAQDNPIRTLRWIRIGHRRHQRFGVRVHRPPVQLFGCRQLDHFADVHYRHP